MNPERFDEPSGVRIPRRNDAGPQPALHRGLRRIDVVALTVNTVVGAGVFAMPAAIAASAGHASLLVLFVAFFIVAVLALSMAEVGSRFDGTGGPPVYAAQAFGPLAGFVVGWLYATSRVAAFAAIAAIMLDYAAALWPALQPALGRNLALTVFLGAVTAINLRGVTRGAAFGNVLTAAKLLPLLLLAFAGLWLAGWNHLPASSPEGWAGLNRALLLALFACFGFEQVAIVTGEMRDPKRDLPVSMLGGLGVSGGLYLLLMLACFATLPDLAASKRPLADAAQALTGSLGGTAMAVAAVLVTAGGLAASIQVAPRVFFALGQSGDLPRALAAVDPRTRAPRNAILFMAVTAWLVTVTGTFVYIVTVFVVVRVIVYGSTAAALLRLRQLRGPAPLALPAGRLIAVLALLSCVAVVATASLVALRDVAILLAVGLILRALVRRRKSSGSPSPG